MPVGDPVKSSKTDRDMPVLNLPETRLKTFPDDAPMHDDQAGLDCAVHRAEPPECRSLQGAWRVFPRIRAWRRPAHSVARQHPAHRRLASETQRVSHGFHVLQHAPISRCMNMLENRGVADSIPLSHVPVCGMFIQVNNR